MKLSEAFEILNFLNSTDLTILAVDLSKAIRDGNSDFIGRNTNQEFDRLICSLDNAGLLDLHFKVLSKLESIVISNEDEV